MAATRRSLGRSSTSRIFRGCLNASPGLGLALHSLTSIEEGSILTMARTAEPRQQPDLPEGLRWRSDGVSPEPLSQRGADVNGTGENRPAETDSSGVPKVDRAAELEVFDRFHPIRVASDLRVAFLLFNDARYRVIRRLFRVSRRDEVNVVTVIGLLLVADALHEKVEGLITGPGGPTRGDVLFASGALNGILVNLGGSHVEETPLLGTLVAGALFAGLARGVTRRTLHGAREGSHELRRSFNHRYGRLIGRHRPRSS